MMHVDKNTDGHVLDQMWTESQGRLPTYLLEGGSGLNVAHACSPFFFFAKKMSTRHAYQWFDGFEVLDVLYRGPWFEIWICFPEVRWIEV